jgi:Flp pilus assembly protein TadD
MARNKKKERKKAPRNAQPTKLEMRIAEATAYVRFGQFEKAEEILHSLDRTHPTHPSVIHGQIDLAIEMDDDVRLLGLADRLCQVRPNDSYPHLLRAGVFLKKAWVLQALTAFRTVLQRWPTDPQAERVRLEISRIEEYVPKLLDHHGIAGPNQLEHALLHEQVLLHLHKGETEKGRLLAEQLLKVQPRYIPVLNNLATCCVAEGDYANAARAIQQALELDAENAFARANEVEFHVRTGKMAEARAAA